jgi:hypothetical protein
VSAGRRFRPARSAGGRAAAQGSATGPGAIAGQPAERAAAGDGGAAFLCRYRARARHPLRQRDVPARTRQGKAQPDDGWAESRGAAGASDVLFVETMMNSWPIME